MVRLLLIGVLLLGLGFATTFIGNGFSLNVSSVQASLGLLIYIAALSTRFIYKGRLSGGLTIATYIAYAVGAFLIVLGVYNTVIKWIYQ